MADFEGRVALVTGGAQGIGQATVRRLVADGARVAVVDLNEPEAGGPDVLSLVGDVSDEASVEAAFAATVERFGRVDMVFNNAGIAGVTKPLVELTLDDYEQMYRVCERGVFLVLRAAMRTMLAQGGNGGGGGAIVNTASSAGIRGRDQRAHYCAAKHAVVGLTRAAAVEGGRHGIRVNAICPGPIETPLITSVVDGWGEGDREQGRRALLGRVPLDRIGQPEEAAALVCWLLGPDAGFVTGGIYTVDGGATAA